MQGGEDEFVFFMSLLYIASPQPTCSLICKPREQEVETWLLRIQALVE